MFKHLLQQLLTNPTQENASDKGLQNSEIFTQVNQQSIDLTIASFCIVNQSWHCFAELVNAIGTQDALESLVSPSLDQGRGKKPLNYAEETDQMQEFEQVLAWFESFPSKDNQPVALQHQVSGHLSLD